MRKIWIGERSRLIWALSLGAVVALAGCGVNLVALKAPGFADVDDPIAYCNLSEGDLIVLVTNVGDEVAGASTTRVTFTTLPTGNFVVDLPTPAIAPGEEVELGPISFDEFPSNCFQPDCFFEITVDVEDVVEESIEDNTVEGYCLG